MKCILTIFFLFTLSIISYPQKGKQKRSSTNVSEKLIIDTSLIAILPIDEKESLFDSSREIELINQELILIDSLMVACLNVYNKTVDTVKRSWLGYISLVNYKRQYVPFYINGERKIFVNCFHRGFPFALWKKVLLSADGGGDLFFSLMINLTTKKYYDFWVNAQL